MEYLNFNEICKTVPFKKILDHLSISYSETREGLKGRIENISFKVDPDRNLLFYLPSGKYASPIQFIYDVYETPKREAAKWLKDTFLAEPKKPKREIPELALEHHQIFDELGITDETKQAFEAGYCKKRGEMQGKIAFKVYDIQGNKTGYVGWKVKEKEWHFPKGFVRCVYNLWTANQQYAILTKDPFAVLYLYQLGFPYAYSLMASNLSENQEEELKRFRRILLVDNFSDNVLRRLSNHAFVKMPNLSRGLYSLDENNVKALF